MAQIRGNTQIISGTITDTQINSAAAIASSKLADGSKLFFKDGTIAATAAFNLGGFQINSLGTPTATTDAATKGYVDAATAGLNIKQPVRVATTGALPGATYANGSSGVNATLTITSTTAIDGVTLANGDRILVKDQASQFQNGIYTYTSSTVLTRAIDFNSLTGGAPIQFGDFIIVNEGSTWKAQAFILTEPGGYSGSITIGTTAFPFTAYGSPTAYSAGNGISISGNVITFRNGNSLTFNSGVTDVRLADASLAVATGGLQVTAYAGLVTGSSGLAVNAGNGLTLPGSPGSILSVLNADNTISVITGGIKVNFAAGTSGLGVVTGGLGIALDTNSGLQCVTGLKIMLADSTLQLGGSGLSLASLASGKVLIGNVSNVATAQTITGDITITSGGVATLAAAAAGSGGLKYSNIAQNEVPTGTVNGSNAAFTLAFTPFASSESVYLNGLRQKRTTDYTISGAVVTMIPAPTTGDTLFVDYIH